MVNKDGDVIKDGDAILAILIVVAFIAVVLLFGAVIGIAIKHDAIYKQGQVDALTGKVQYELVEHDDGTKTWEWINE